MRAPSDSTMPIKPDSLDARIATLGADTGLAIAYSGGVDSTLLAVRAHGVLDGKALAITVAAPLHASEEIERAGAIAARIGFRHEILPIELDWSEAWLRENPADRCYHCKRRVFQAIQAAARAHGIEAIADGTVLDDQADHRPGRRALRELGVHSPLAEAGWDKTRVRAASRALALETAELPAAACLASRVPYGTAIDEARLRRIEAAEAALHALGYLAVRVRDHAPVARIELPPAELEHALARRESIQAAVQEAGFRYVALDLAGYRTGSLNETLPAKALEVRQALEDRQEQ